MSRILLTLREMEENLHPSIFEGEIVGIKFGLATQKEISTASISECPISHSFQLTNPFLGLPLEFGKCESCGTSELGECEGHFGYIELPTAIYHPSHVSELKRMLSLLCLKCLKLKTNKMKNNNGIADQLISCCEEATKVSVSEVKTSDGVSYLQLKVPRKQFKEGLWNFLGRYGVCYGDDHIRTLLPSEAMEILKRIPQETRRKLATKGYFPQDGYILRYLPVPPNCLSMPEISDGVSVMSSDLSVSMLKKVLRQIEMIRRSRSGTPNFESHQVEAIDLQSVVNQYLQVRGTSKSSRDVDVRYAKGKESGESSTKAWLEKMKTLFIRKGSGFSSRSVITGDAYKLVNEIGIPSEIARRITFEERVNVHNKDYLQKLVDNNLCLTYKDGSTTFSLREGSKGHTFLRLGQVVHRRIMDGDIVFINRPPTTHKHSLQALSVYVHDDHTVKINPLICGPLSADFDGDCIHLFYPQSLSAKSEVLELFSVEKQLVSSHSGHLNLQFTTDSLLSLKTMLKTYFFNRATSQQLAMFLSFSLPHPSLSKTLNFGPFWTALQIIQSALPTSFKCSGDSYLISEGEIVKFDLNRDALQSVINEVMTSIFFERGPKSVLQFFNYMQPLLMENLFSKGFSFSLEDFYLSKAFRSKISENFKAIAPLLRNLRSSYNVVVERQLETHIRNARRPVANFIVNSSVLGDLIDAKSDSSITKVAQQIGFLGLQLSDRGKLYSKILADDMVEHFGSKYPIDNSDYHSLQYGLICNCFFHGLDPYEEMVHSISTREVMVRSSRGLSEPGTLFKNLMAILRDVVICYDGTIRNACSNSIIQLEYGVNAGTKSQDLFPAGEPVGVLAATAMSNPAYKAVLDSTPSSNSSWELMKEILLCKASFKNDFNDRRVILYLRNCECGKKYCQEKAAYLVKNHLEKITLKDVISCFMIEYTRPQTMVEQIASGLIGHLHLKKVKLQELNVSMQVILQKCEETVKSYLKKKKIGHYFKNTTLSISERCSFRHFCSDQSTDEPCLLFFRQGVEDFPLDYLSSIFADVIYPIFLETIIKGDHRICSANIVWVSPDTPLWMRHPSETSEGALALDIVVQKSVAKQSGDAWRTVLDSCLPVLHLIDTRHSVPYAIKQVQELLGISCAFETAVQHLATSVKMVAKGLLKEHLILLANSMTCTGSLVGFNSGGYRALSHSLDIHVPFTEATLFTPRRCFERAAEKCHVDTLSSVVASCSWGKHVAVGTGSRFDVLWETKNIQACFDRDGSIDVCQFLNMMSGAANGEDSVTACLGQEVDDLVHEDDANDWSLSPDRNALDKPSFEDSLEFDWDAAPQKESNWSSGWDPEAASANDSGWKTAKAKTCDLQSKSQEDSAWGADASKVCKGEDLVLSSWDTEAAKTKASSGWGTGKSKSHDSTSKTQEGSAWVANSSKVNEVEDLALSGWGGWNTESANPNTSSGWGTGKPKTHGLRSNAEEDSAWGVDTSGNSKGEGLASSGWVGWEAANPIASSGWDIGKAKTCDLRSNPQQDPTQGVDTSRNRKGEDFAFSGWGGRETEASKPSASSGWETGKAETYGLKSKPHEESALDAGIFKDSSGETIDLTSKSQGGSGWVAVSSRDGTDDEAWKSETHKSMPWSSWGMERSEKQDNVPSKGQEEPARSNNWDAGSGLAEESKDMDESSSAWENIKSDAGSGASEKENPPMMNQGEESSGWDKVTTDQSVSVWAASTAQKSSLKSKGWGPNSGDWKIKKNHPAKVPGIVSCEPGLSGLYTMTRQRLDTFTSEEQDILSDVEPLMQSIRRIMHQSGCNDGDPLSADDQSYVLDNVFNYHPDKAVKMGTGIDYITVSKHIGFQDSRCFYVVSTDGCKRDFSYRKCLENYVKGKYPELGPDFVEKYFTRSRPRGNRQRNPGDETKQ
ncbi:hypothetical protein K2173_009706 [Erythroxylum novogranatense]|uniref:DNA-directed RNA polymerase subunit n=1 Tax=Erythroxylum novogranatense TaxID=1862640 RepID=A0AAV8U7G3_9ROSI|nr:hypothetical protein K2173_009706 [Erythroxylum novogranatense]